MQFVDIGGLVEGASKGEGLGNRFLGGIREVDAIVFVLRAFADDDVPGPIRPARAPADRRDSSWPWPTSRRSRASSTSAARRPSRIESLADEVAALERANAALAEGTPLYRAALDADDRALLRPYFLLTNKPVLAVVNVGEDELDAHRRASWRRCEAELRRTGRRGASACACSSRPRRRSSTSDERAEMLEALGLGEGALPRLVRAAYHLLGLRTFLTTGDKESRAWTFRAGAKAPECAGVIHTDFERGFIRAEVIHWDELLEIGSW